MLYFLDDLTPEHSPFLVIPHSHLSLHADGNPYGRYMSHPEQVRITCKAGSAAIINQTVTRAVGMCRVSRWKREACSRSTSTSDAIQKPMSPGTGLRQRAKAMTRSR